MPHRGAQSLVSVRFNAKIIRESRIVQPWRPPVTISRYAARRLPHLEGSPTPGGGDEHAVHLALACCAYDLHPRPPWRFSPWLPRFLQLVHGGSLPQSQTRWRDTWALHPCTPNHSPCRRWTACRYFRRGRKTPENDKTVCGHRHFSLGCLQNRRMRLR